MLQELSAVTGACLMVRRDVYELAGGLNEELAVAFNDIDYLLKSYAELGFPKPMDSLRRVLSP